MGAKPRRRGTSPESTRAGLRLLLSPPVLICFAFFAMLRCSPALIISPCPVWIACSNRFDGRQPGTDGLFVWHFRRYFGGRLDRRSDTPSRLGGGQLFRGDRGFDGDRRQCRLGQVALVTIMAVQGVMQTIMPCVI